MAEGGLDRPAFHARWLLAAAVLLAAVQIALAYRAAYGYTDDFWATTAIAWLAALYLLWENRDVPTDAGIGRRADSTPALPSVAWRIAGALIALGAVVAMAVTPRYRAFDRVMPLVAGAGLGLAAFGPAPDRRLGSALALLALPVLNPLPHPLRNLVTPALIYASAHSATLTLHIAGSPVAIDGTTLTTPGGALNIKEGCSGIFGISRLWVVAALVVALFPTTPRQKVLLFATGAAVGLLMNIGHIAAMAQAVVRRDDASFDYWHQGTGGAMFAVGSMGVAGLCWWLATRRPSS
jgi:exosortase